MPHKPPGVSDDVEVTVAGVRVFAATEDRPPRPDLPILRNWSHTKSHSVILGVAVGLFFGLALAWGRRGVIMSVGVFLIEQVFGEGQKRAKSSTCEHGVGFHDVRKKPWYFVAGVVSTAMVLLAVTP